MTNVPDESGAETTVQQPGLPGRRRKSHGSTRSLRRRRVGGSIVRLIVLYMLAALGAFVLCALGLALAQRHVALQEAVRDAEGTSALLATRVVAPALPATSTDGLADDASFDRVIRTRVLVEPMTQARVVDETGTVLYATEPGLAGQRVELSAEELRALRTTTVTATRGDGSDPTRLDGGRPGQLLDVGAGLLR